MNIELISTHKTDELYTNYDYKKYTVKNDKGDFIGHIYEHSRWYLIEDISHHYQTIEQAVEYLVTKNESKTPWIPKR